MFEHLCSISQSKGHSCKLKKSKWYCYCCQLILQEFGDKLIRTDISIGAVLQQHLDDKWRLLFYFSRKLSPAKQQTFCPWTNTAFDALHNMSHSGIRATQRLVTTHFFWPGMNSHIRHWARSCIQFQKVKVHCHTITLLAIFNTPDVRFDHVHIELVGSLPTSKGFNYLFTCVDHFTRWPKAFPITDISTQTVAQAYGFLDSVYLPPLLLTEDLSPLWTQLT